MAPNLNRLPTIILIQGARSPSIQFLPTNLEMPPTIIFKWAPNKNIDPRGPGLLNLMFANQFKRITPVKLKVFILQVATLGLHLIF